MYCIGLRPMPPSHISKTRKLRSIRYASVQLQNFSLRQKNTCTLFSFVKRLLVENCFEKQIKC
jgi:hypothetical protein